MTSLETEAGRRDHDKRLGELLGELSEEFNGLMSAQVDLAKTELRREVAKAGRAASALGSAAVTAWFALLLLSFAAAWGLAEVMATAWAFLIVGGVYALVAVVLAVWGRSKAQEMRKPVETDTARTLKEDAQWARQRLS